MSQNIITKRCPKCKTVKRTPLFQKDRTKKDGYHALCKACVKAYKEIHRQTKKGKESQKRGDIKKRLKFPERLKARQLLNYAVESERLTRPEDLKCTCGENAEEYHHIDYHSHGGLNVTPYCIPCHKKLHKVVTL